MEMLPFTSRRWRLAHGREVELGPKALIVGILNVTPDSFSDGGHFASFEQALAQARRMVEEGAAIIDVGGESTKPAAVPVSAAEEQGRVLPVIEALARDGVLISIDTYRAETARLAVDGRRAYRQRRLGPAARDRRSPGLRSTPAPGWSSCTPGAGARRSPTSSTTSCSSCAARWRSHERPRWPTSSSCSTPASASPRRPPEENFDLMVRFGELHALGLPLMAGTSRKRFIGSATGREPADRGAGTAATSAILRLKGAALFRVHDVAINRDALAIADAMIGRMEHPKT